MFYIVKGYINKMENLFPFLKKGFIYMDSAATSLKPQSVIDSESDYYKNLAVNTGRGSNKHNYNTTQQIEKIRTQVSEFIGCNNSGEIVFTKNCTDSINMVANSYVRNNIPQNANIVITQLEHHSNYVPWLILSRDLGIESRIVPLKNYNIDYDALEKLVDEKTFITSITGMSNVTGAISDIERVISVCRKKGSKILIDAAQLICHKEIDLNKIDPDFLTFSAHKIYGPFGLGVLYGKSELLKEFTPINYGGNMVSYITNKTEIHYKELPAKLESGTQNSAAIYAFGTTLDLLDKIINIDNENQINSLSRYLIDSLEQVGGITIYSKPGSIISFNIDGVHPHDASDFFDSENIILRTGNLCASPFFTNMEVGGVIRISLSIFNTRDEVDKVIKCIERIKEFFL